jgi:hypothetical protein
MKLLPTILREILAVVDLVIIPVLWTRSRNWGLVDFRISVKVTAPWQVERTAMQHGPQLGHISHIQDHLRDTSP